jgi:hypothetical protein
MVRARSMDVWIGPVLGMVWSTAAWCGETVPSGYRAIAAEYEIPYTILYAIALAESGRSLNDNRMRLPWPWTLNVAGRGYYYSSREAAWNALNSFIVRGEQSIDIGLMQVSWKYHKDKLGNTWQALDPYHNLRVAAGILQGCFNKRRDWWASVGCYHSPANTARAQRYRLRVVVHWQRLDASG